MLRTPSMSQRRHSQQQTHPPRLNLTAAQRISIAFDTGVLHYPPPRTNKRIQPPARVRNRYDRPSLENMMDGVAAAPTATKIPAPPAVQVSGASAVLDAMSPRALARGPSSARSAAAASLSRPSTSASSPVSPTRRDQGAARSPVPPPTSSRPRTSPEQTREQTHALKLRAVGAAHGPVYSPRWSRGPLAQHWLPTTPLQAIVPSPANENSLVPPGSCKVHWMRSDFETPFNPSAGAGASDAAMCLSNQEQRIADARTAAARNAFERGTGWLSVRGMDVDLLKFRSGALVQHVGSFATSAQLFAAPRKATQEGG